MFTVFTICVTSLLRILRSAKLDRKKRCCTWCHLVYTIVMFIQGTLYLAANTRGAQLEYIYNPDFPGGPLAYSATVSQDPTTRMGSVSYIVSNWMSDCLVLWRVIVLYHGSRCRVWVIILHSMIFLGVIAAGIFVMVHSSLTDQPFYSERSAQYVTLYYALTLSLSLIATVLVVSRVHVHKRRLRKALGPGHDSPYTSISTMTIESSGLYALWSCIFLVLYVVDNPIQLVFLASLCQVQIISPLLVILSVSQGKAWTPRTDTGPISTLRFASNVVLPSPEVDACASNETLPSTSSRGMNTIAGKLSLPSSAHLIH
ncbi:hypothetical protein BV22DRAFT_1007997 [Leucogyrophana mollusca]|uniref:Uncharacterized protein n=1 Tax=Leucogyrophana mollusca TaxID=85980 RepID=A0ACB8BNY4_9AGAM|nr:hypothetical protein BV22DRAFT_1007997 [Leucogyrophana mollusca]